MIFVIVWIELKEKIFEVLFNITTIILKFLV